MKISERAMARTGESEGRIVPDNELELALDWLRDNAAAIGEAKRQAVLSERWVKHVEAIEMKRCSGQSAAAQKREAQASDSYRMAIMAEAIAAGEYEKMRALREAAAAKIEAWRSEQANYRAMKI